MRLTWARLILGILLTSLGTACVEEGSSSDTLERQAPEKTPIQGAYLGQPPPRLQPEIFAPGIASTPAFELNSAFTPDGEELYQTLVVEGFSFSAIVFRREEATGWSAPQVAPFSGRYNDIDPNLSPDGNRIFFISRRPLNPADHSLAAAWDIWTAVRDHRRAAWSEAQRLPDPVNSPAAELYPSVSSSGTLYFGSNREGGFGGFDIYRSRWTESGYMTVENLGDRINSEQNESDAFVSPDESYLVVTVTGRPDSRGKNDLYLSFRQGDGSWGELHHMADSVNTPAKEYCPVVTPDGRFFFFTRGRDDSRLLHSDQKKTYEELADLVYSWRNNLENIYWVDAKVLQRGRYESP